MKTLAASWVVATTVSATIGITMIKERTLAGAQLGDPSAVVMPDIRPEKKLPLPGEVFSVAGHTAFIIPTKKDSCGKAKPWVWYAPTLPSLPGPDEKWMFEQFGDAGIAVAGIDVGESYGSPAGRKLFTAFYAELTATRGYSRKPVLLGRSRGGLMTLSWMAENPDKVAAFAGIYPVSNLASYPGVSTAAGAYEMKAEELQSKLAQHNPIDRLEGLVKAGIPLFAIHGDVELSVPLEANSGLLRERYTSLGGTMELIVPPGQGHNMWPGFFKSEALVKFVKTHVK
jgi:pimeloyl-ACP methyl ester carboxylesterase